MQILLDWIVLALALTVAGTIALWMAGAIYFDVCNATKVGKTLAFAWIIGVVAIIAWRRGRLGAWALVALTAIELGTLYHLGPVRWGWSVPISETSPILARRPAHPVRSCSWPSL